MLKYFLMGMAFYMAFADPTFASTVVCLIMSNVLLLQEEIQELKNGSKSA